MLKYIVAGMIGMMGLPLAASADHVVIDPFALIPGYAEHAHRGTGYYREYRGHRRYDDGYRGERRRPRHHDEWRGHRGW